MKSFDNKPFVHVIVPVYNAQRFIAKCLQALSEQDYPKDRHKIIIVDNGSNDRTQEIIRSFDSVTMLIENKVQSSYAARNMGLGFGKAEIFAFTDGDCIPKKDWLSKGVDFLVSKKSDLVGGHVNFVYTKRYTAAEIYDSFINMQNHSCIPDRGVAKTANIFIKASVFDGIGYFDSSLKSGGDVLFTKKATTNGFKLTYCRDAIVSHPTRKFGELMNKAFRTGFGKGRINSDLKRSAVFRQFVKQIFSPPNPLFWRDRVIEERIPASRFKIVRISIVMYILMILSRFSEFLGRLSVKGD